MQTDYPTVENGMLNKTKYAGIYTIAKDKKLPQRFKDFILSLTYDLTVDDYECRDRLLFYNNESHMVIVSHAIPVDINDLNNLNDYKNIYDCALLTHAGIGTNNFSAAKKNPNCIKCSNCKTKAALLIFTYDDKQHSFCSTKCHKQCFKRLDDEKDKLSKSLTTCDMNDVNACHICCEYKKNCVLNCGHTICYNCVKNMQDCSFCKQKITNINPLYL